MQRLIILNHYESCMVRTSVTFTDSDLREVDSKAKEKGLSRSDYIAACVDSSLHGSNPEMNQVRMELNQSKMELMQSQQRISKFENQIAEKDNAIKAATEELNHINANLNQLQTEVAKYESAMKIKDDEISFLRAHVAQQSQNINTLTTKIPALPPGPEEKKHWYKFWK